MAHVMTRREFLRHIRAALVGRALILFADLLAFLPPRTWAE